MWTHDNIKHRYENINHWIIECCMYVYQNQYLVTPVCQADDITTFATLSEGTIANRMFFAYTTRIAPSPAPNVTPFRPVWLFIQPGNGSLYELTTENINNNK